MLGTATLSELLYNKMMMSSFLTALTDLLLGWRGLRIIAAIAPIDLEQADGAWKTEVLGQVDSTQENSLIDRGLARELGIYSVEQVVEKVDALEVIMVTFKIEGEVKRSRWMVVDRPKEKFLVVLGRNDLAGFLIQV